MGGAGLDILLSQELLIRMSWFVLFEQKLLLPRVSPVNTFDHEFYWYLHPHFLRYFSRYKCSEGMDGILQKINTRQIFRWHQIFCNGN